MTTTHINLYIKSIFDQPQKEKTSNVHGATPAAVQFKADHRRPDQVDGVQGQHPQLDREELKKT
jgi:hypothetical protein